jgi:hypothetical protein
MYGDCSTTPAKLKGCGSIEWTGLIAVAAQMRPVLVPD